MDQVTVGFRENARNPGHTQVSVFVGRNRGARGHSGQITLRTDEWEELRDTIEELGPHFEGRFEILAPLHSEAT